MAKTCWFTPGARQNHTGRCVFLIARFDARVGHVVAVVGQAVDRLRLDFVGRADVLPTDAKIEEVTTRIDHAVGIPSAPATALKATTACGRNLSWRVSSSRVQTSFTGRCTTFAMAMACLISSLASRRPKPPPTKPLWT